MKNAFQAALCAAALLIAAATALAAQDNDARSQKRSLLEDILTIPAAPIDGVQTVLEQTIFNLGEIKVSGARVDSPHSLELATELPRNVTVIGERELSDTSFAGLPGLLSAKEGVTVTDELGLGLNARVDLRGFGGEAKQALVLIDGVRAVEPFDNSVVWHLYPQEYLRRVEVRRGGGSTTYGEGALSGVINMKTKGPTEKLKFTTEHSFGNFQTVRDFFDVSGTAGPLGYYVGARYAATDGYRRNGDFESSSALIKNTYEWSDVLTAENAFYYAADKTGIPGPLTPAEAAQNRRQKDPDGQFGDDFKDDLLQDVFTSSLYLESIGVELSNMASFRHRDQNSLQSFGGTFGGTSLNDIKTYTYSDALQARYTLEGKGYRTDLTTGLEWSIDDIHNPSLFVSAFGPFASDRAIDRRMVGVFMQDRAQLGDRWVLEAGVRWDRIDWDIYDLLNPDQQREKLAESVSPEAGIEYRIVDPLWAYASYAESFKVPDANTLIFATPNLFTPNPAIDPSVARDWEGGLRYAHPVFGSVRAGYFYIETKKEILFNAISTLNENFDTKRQGLELADEIAVTPWLGLFFNYTYTRAEFDNGRFDGKTVPLVPGSAWTAGTSLGPWRGWSLMVRATGVSDRFALNDFSNIFPQADYWTLGTRLAYKQGAWEFYVRGDNVLNEEYSSFITSNGANTINVNPAPTGYFEGGFRLEL